MFFTRVSSGFLPRASVWLADISTLLEAGSQKSQIRRWPVGKIMTTLSVFRKAATRWPILAASNNEAHYEPLCADERNILARIPGSLAEAGVILDVIIAQDGDTRADGRDWAALCRIRKFLRSLPK